MAKKKFYVVWTGKETGVFTSWDKCKKQIEGFKGAEYKSFESSTEAEEAFKKNYTDFKGQKVNTPSLSAEEIARIGKPNMNSFSVDAACSGNPGVMEYQGVLTDSKKVIFKKGTYQQSSNNIGEFLALVHALALLKQKKDHRPIYSDSRTAISWVKKKRCNSKIERNKKNEDSFELVDRAVKWLHHNSIENPILKWETKAWGEIPADFGRK